MRMHGGACLGTEGRRASMGGERRGFRGGGVSEDKLCLPPKRCLGSTQLIAQIRDRNEDGGEGREAGNLFQLFLEPYEQTNGS